MATWSTTELAVAIPKMVATAALPKLIGYLPMKTLVATNWANEIKDVGDTVDIRKPVSVTVQDKTAGTALTPQSVTATKVSVVLNKYKTVPLLGEDIAIVESQTNTWENILEETMMDLAVQIEDDIVAEAANGTISTTGTQGTAATAATVRAFRKKLMDAKPLRGDPLYVVVGTQTETDLIGQDIVAQSNQRGSDLTIRTGEIGNIYGLQFFLGQRISRTGGGDKNVGFAKSSLAVVSRPLPIPDPSEGATGAISSDNGFSIRYTRQWDNLNLGRTSIFSTLYAVKAVRPELIGYIYGA